MNTEAGAAEPTARWRGTMHHSPGPRTVPTYKGLSREARFERVRVSSRHIESVRPKLPDANDELKPCGLELAAYSSEEIEATLPMGR